MRKEEKKITEKKKEERSYTVFQPSGSKHAVILVLITGKGPGSRVTCPPHSLIASAAL